MTAKSKKLTANRIRYNKSFVRELFRQATQASKLSERGGKGSEAGDHGLTEQLSTAASHWPNSRVAPNRSWLTYLGKTNYHCSFTNSSARSWNHRQIQ